MASHAPLNLQDWIAACVRRALQGQAPAALREYSFSFDELAKRITLEVDVERDLTEDERESLAVVETEVYSDLIFGNDTIVKTEIIVVYDGTQLDPLGSRDKVG